LLINLDVLVEKGFLNKVDVNTTPAVLEHMVDYCSWPAKRHMLSSRGRAGRPT
jgi:hypothetical protein